MKNIRNEYKELNVNTERKINMNAENFEVGDVVRLKSGSPNMTIVELGKYSGSGKTQAMCQWFSGERVDEVKKDIFALEALEKKG